MSKEISPTTSGIQKNIEKNLEDSKAINITTMDLSDKSDICSYMIVASGTSDRHVISIAEKLIYHLKHIENIDFKTEGLDEGKWVLIDTISIVVHIFLPEVRDLYHIEELWSETLQKTQKGS